MKLLVAVDPSEYALKVARYVAAVARPDVEVTLFSVLPNVSAKMESELYHPLFSEKMSLLKGVDAQQEEVLHKTMQDCAKILEQSGIHNVEIVTEKKQNGIARDIIAKAGDAQFDTVVVGKRGLSAASAFVLGSVSQKVVNNLKNVTVWVVE
ncbi:MAG: universal stress protein [Thermodesulfobacteriota bacterium]